MSGRLRILWAALLILASSAAWTLDLRGGRILLSLDEKTARFTLHYLVDAERNRYVPLLYEQEPRTSYPTLSWNGKYYRLGETAEFRFSVRKEGESAVVEYKSAFAVVRQTFTLIRSSGSPDMDGLLVGFDIENISGSSASAGLRLLWDTYLGERSKRHFEIDSLGTVGMEMSLSGTTLPRRILSPGDAAVTLQVQLSGTGISKPDRLVLANWKRINDSGWAFDVSAGRSFTLLPYSIDDSAAALYYEPVELRSGAVRVLRSVLGNRSDAGYSAPVLAADTAAPAPGSAPPVLQSASNPFVGVRTDIAALREILSRIDALLASGKSPSEDDLKQMRTLLEQIRERRKGY